MERQQTLQCLSRFTFPNIIKFFEFLLNRFLWSRKVTELHHVCESQLHVWGDIPKSRSKTQRGLTMTSSRYLNGGGIFSKFGTVHAGAALDALCKQPSTNIVGTQSKNELCSTSEVDVRSLLGQRNSFQFQSNRSCIHGAEPVRDAHEIHARHHMSEALPASRASETMFLSRSRWELDALGDRYHAPCLHRDSPPQLRSVCRFKSLSKKRLRDQCALDIRRENGTRPERRTPRTYEDGRSHTRVMFFGAFFIDATLASAHFINISCNHCSFTCLRVFFGLCDSASTSTCPFLFLCLVS